jgi:hypothetical protein
LTTAARVLLVFVVGAMGVLASSRLVRIGSENPAIEGREAGSLYNPVHAGEELPKGFRDVLPRDAILPIYDPRFVSASQSGWDDRSLVVGLEINGDARAYPVSFLNRREIVNDHVGKTPILVTW